LTDENRDDVRKKPENLTTIERLSGKGGFMQHNKIYRAFYPINLPIMSKVNFTKHTSIPFLCVS
jgi:hypothetical protein